MEPILRVSIRMKACQTTMVKNEASTPTAFCSIIRIDFFCTSNRKLIVCLVYSLNLFFREHLFLIFSTVGLQSTTRRNVCPITASSIGSCPFSPATSSTPLPCFKYSPPNLLSLSTSQIWLRFPDSCVCVCA